MGDKEKRTLTDHGAIAARIDKHFFLLAQLLVLVLDILHQVLVLGIAADTLLVLERLPRPCVAQLVLARRLADQRDGRDHGGEGRVAIE